MGDSYQIKPQPHYQLVQLGSEIDLRGMECWDVSEKRWDTNYQWSASFVPDKTVAPLQMFKTNVRNLIHFPKGLHYVRAVFINEKGSTPWAKLELNPNGKVLYCSDNYSLSPKRMVVNAARATEIFANTTLDPVRIGKTGLRLDDLIDALEMLTPPKNRHVYLDSFTIAVNLTPENYADFSVTYELAEELGKMYVLQANVAWMNKKTAKLTPAEREVMLGEFLGPFCRMEKKGEKTTGEDLLKSCTPSKKRAT